MQTTLETSGLGGGGDRGDLEAKDWRQKCSFGAWGVEITLESERLGVHILAAKSLWSSSLPPR